MKRLSTKPLEARGLLEDDQVAQTSKIIFSNDQAGRYGFMSLGGPDGKL